MPRLLIAIYAAIRHADASFLFRHFRCFFATPRFCRHIRLFASRLFAGYAAADTLLILLR